MRAKSLPASTSGGETQRLGLIVVGLAGWADDDANVLARLIALREPGREEDGWELLPESPVAMADLACEGAELLQAFRPQVVNQVRNDLEFAVVLLAAAALAAKLILESNLRQWRSPALHARFGPQAGRLALRVAALTPVDHIAWR